jgi:hypothetical protein
LLYKPTNSFGTRAMFFYPAGKSKKKAGDDKNIYPL